MDYTFPKIRLGLCCINITTKYKFDAYTNRKRILKTLMDKGLKEGEEVAKYNVIDLLKIFLWNKNHGIDVMRISSDLVPHGSNKELIDKYGKKGETYLSLEFLRPYLKIVGDVAKLEKMRLTFHPGQFVQLGSPNKEVVKKSITELKMHTTFLDMMEMPKESVIVIHIGGTYCDKDGTIERFIETINKLPEDIRSRLVLENDEKCYDAEDVLKICEKVNIPHVLDIFHYYCYGKLHPEKKQKSLGMLMQRTLNTWIKRDIRPKFHLSEQMDGKPVGSHSLFIENIPKDLLEIPSKYNIDIDIMIEAKGKEVAIGNLYKKYPKLKPKYRKDLPLKIPKQALNDLKLPDEIKNLAECFCE